MGGFAVKNLSLAVSIMMDCPNITKTQIKNAISACPQVPGRMQVIHRHPTVILDYAHTPDALKSLLVTARNLVTRKITSGFWLWWR